MREIICLTKSCTSPTVLGNTQQNGAATTLGRTAPNLTHSTNLAPPQENGSQGSGTLPADTGGDPCPRCASPPPLTALAPGVAAVAVDPSLSCRCGDKARGGHTGGEPVAAADAVTVKPGGGGGVGRAYPGVQQQQQQQQAHVMVATESAGGGGGRQEEAQAAAAAATVVGLTTTTMAAAPVSFQQQYVDPRVTSVGGTAAMMVVGGRDPMACIAGESAAVHGIGVADNGGGGGVVTEPWSVCPPPVQEPALITPRESAPTAVTRMPDPGDVGLQQQQQIQLQLQQQQQIEALQADTMDRLAQSLAQAQQLALSVEARQTELLARPKRRSHPSAKQVRATPASGWHSTGACLFSTPVV